MKTQQEELIEELQKDEGVMQFALQEHGRGYVTSSGELLLFIGGSIRSYGQFEKSSDGYYFVYQPVTEMTQSIPEEVHCIDEELAKDLYAFAVKIGYFFYHYPDYECMREHDWDVLLNKNYSELHTPLAKAGFRVEAHSTC